MPPLKSMKPRTKATTPAVVTPTPVGGLPPSTTPARKGKPAAKAVAASRPKKPRTIQHPKTQSEVARSLKTVFSSNREGRVFGLLYVQLDGWDAIEARVGESGGEELLRLAYRRLMVCVRTTDMVAVGERGIFLIVANDLNSEEELEIISDRIQASCLKPYVLDKEEIVAGITIGGAGTAGGSGATELIERAVSAMNHAASRGIRFELSRATPAKALTADGLAPGDSQASHHESFGLAFVPQFHADNSLAGARVVVEIPKARMQARGKEAASSETKGQKRDRVRDHVLRRVLEQAEIWRDKGLLVPVLSVEILASQFLSAGFADSVVRALRETNTRVSCLELLLTEATTLAVLAEAAPTISTLDGAGVRLGLSGFSFNAGTHLDLRKLPFTSLRVSCRSLFRVMSAAESLWVARSIVSVARRCGLEFVGEDVETDAQKAILLESGCERFEGPLFSLALKSLDFEGLLVHE